MDSFDDIWRNRFNTNKVDESEWNVPDDGVWEGVASYIEADKRKRRVFIILLLAFLLLLTGILAGAYLNTKTPVSIEQLTPREQQKKYPEQLLIMVDSLFSYKVIPGKLPTNYQSDLQTTLKSLSENNPITEFSNNQNSKSTKAISRSANSYVSSTTVVSQKNKAAIQAKTHEKRMVFIEENSLTEILGTIKRLPTLSSLITYEEEVLDMRNLKPIEPRSTANSRKWSITLASGSTLLKHRISEKYSSDLSPFDFNYSDEWGWHTKLQLKFVLNNRLDIYTGLKYEQLSSTSGHNSSLNYNPDAENTSMNNVYALSLATPYGLSDASFILSRNQDLAEDVELLVDFKSNHRLHNYSIPLGVSFYPFGKKGNIQPGIELGLGINYLSTINNQIKSIDTHHDAIQYANSDETAYNAPVFKNWHFDYHIGAGIAYQITHTINANLNFNFSRGITPIFEQENYHTRIDRYSLGLGLAKRF
ncbi:MAG: hypothetical protein MI974_12230 [Chitinophagales bacterium]|nr:hypothetical protein [Chitinophagales bacterium]